MSKTVITETQLLSLVNLHLKSHPDFIDGMSFDSITTLPNGKFEVRTNFEYGGKSIQENYPTGSKVYNEILTKYLP